MTKVSLTVDLEDPTGEYEANGRYVEMTDKILELCEKSKRQATFFVVGRMAEEASDLIKRIAEQGHEIAYHSHKHDVLIKETVRNFTTHTREDKDKLEQIIGKAVVGYRAPCFSITPHTRWVTDHLRELGFAYSSSVMPTSLSRFGYPDAPNTPFTWPSGLVELPLPMANFLGAPVPYSGGVYLYLLPSFVTEFFVHRSKPNEVIWTYTHPYDFDITEKFKRLEGASFLTSLILWYARGFAEKKILKLLLAHETAPCLAEVVRYLLVAQKEFTEKKLPSLLLK